MKTRTVLVATWSDGLFAVSPDGHNHEIADVPVRGLAQDGRGGALAVVGGHALWRRAPEGAWTILAESDFELSCCVAVGDVVYAGTDDAQMLRLAHGRRVFETIEAFQSVPGRDTWFAGSAIINGQRVGPPLGVRSLAASSNGTTLFANVHVGGIPRSTDGGRSWYPTMDIQSDVHEVCTGLQDPDIVVAAAAIGLCISRDSGATWTIKTEGLHDSHCYAVAMCGDDILFSAARDPFAAPGRIYRQPLRLDGPIEAVGGGLPEWTAGMVDTACIATNGSSVAVADQGGNLYSSDDFGRTWSGTRSGLPSPSGVLIIEG
jgi:photosystem II stability/assembly factor-like uncharacterized protein